MADDIGVGVRIGLDKPDSFLLVKETLSRIGVASRKEKKLYQSCHILHKRGEYYILHFKELFILDGKPANISEEDIKRRNLIVSLLKDWGLIKVSREEDIVDRAAMSAVKVLSFSDKNSWTLVEKYTIGTKH